MRWMLLMCFPAFAFAETSRRYSIKDPDKKLYCLAVAKAEKSRCYSIKDQDSKNQCLSGFR